jgi:3-hydroxybutyryl-CoA dehydratase
MDRQCFSETLQVGATASMTATISPDMITAFAQLSGDGAPLHTDPDFARAHGFDGCLVHGAFLVALLSRFVGTQFPGRSSLWVKCDISFVSPCYAPSVLRFDATVTQSSEATNAVALTITIADDRQRRIAIAKTMHKVL